MAVPRGPSRSRGRITPKPSIWTHAGRKSLGLLSSASRVVGAEASLFPAIGAGSLYGQLSPSRPYYQPLVALGCARLAESDTCRAGIT